MRADEHPRAGRRLGNPRGYRRELLQGGPQAVGSPEMRAVGSAVRIRPEMSGVMSPQSLAHQLPLGAATATAVLRQLLAQVADLHQAGRFHGRITADNVTWDSGQARLAQGPPS